MTTGPASQRDWIATARTLSEALPYLQRYAGAVVVIKVGGHAMGDDAAMACFARDIVLMSHVGVHPVIVHGGGPMISEMLTALGHESRFVDGRRVTDETTMRIAEMVLSGHVNKRIVQAIGVQGGRAAGLSGKDAGLMRCARAAPELGQVGAPERVDPAALRHLFAGGMIPVIAPVGTGPDGETLNVNADTAAGAIAASLGADRLLLLTDVEGVKDSGGNVIAEITPEDAARLTGEGVIAAGMIPKTETALAAIAGGVRAAVILDGRAQNACLLELFTEHGAGTLIRARR